MISITYWNLFFLVIFLSFIFFILFKIWGGIHEGELKKQADYFNNLLSTKQILFEKIRMERNQMTHKVTLLQHAVTKKDKQLFTAQSTSARRSKKISKISNVFRKHGLNLDEWLKET